MKFPDRKSKHNFVRSHFVYIETANFLYLFFIFLFFFNTINVKVQHKNVRTCFLSGKVYFIVNNIWLDFQFYKYLLSNIKKCLDLDVLQFTLFTVNFFNEMIKRRSGKS